MRTLLAIHEMQIFQLLLDGASIPAGQLCQLVDRLQHLSVSHSCQPASCGALREQFIFLLTTVEPTRDHFEAWEGSGIFFVHCSAPFEPFAKVDNWHIHL